MKHEYVYNPITPRHFHLEPTKLIKGSAASVGATFFPGNFPLSPNGGVSQPLHIYRYLSDYICTAARKSNDEVVSLLWARMQEAKLFRLSPSLVMDYQSKAVEPRISEGIVDVSSFPDYPSHLPFDNTLFIFCDDNPKSGFGGGFSGLMPPVSSDYFVSKLAISSLKKLAQDATKNLLVIHLSACLVTHEEAYVMVHVAGPRGDLKQRKDGLWCADRWSSDAWMIPLYLDNQWIVEDTIIPPSVLVGLIDYINSFQTFVATRKPTTNDWYFFRKKVKKTPPPYYEIKLKQEVLYDQPQNHSGKGGGGRRLNHRVDVRGHECCRVKRGSLPLPADKAEKLRKRGYRVYIHRELSPDDAGRLHRRHMKPKSKEEWVAILSWFREGYTKGPEDAPYIPAIRTP